MPLTSYSCERCSAKGGPAALLAVASFARLPRHVTVVVDWATLGFKAGNVELVAPPIAGFQVAKSFGEGEAIEVQPNEGWLLVLTEK